MKRYRVKVWRIGCKQVIREFETDGENKLISEGGVLLVHDKRGVLIGAYAPHAWSRIEIEEISE